MIKISLYIFASLSLLVVAPNIVDAQAALQCEVCHAAGTASCDQADCKAIRSDCVFTPEDPLSVGGWCIEPPSTTQQNSGQQQTDTSTMNAYEPLAELPLITDSSGKVEIGRRGFIRYLDAVLKIGVALATILAVVVIVMGGLQYMTTGSVTGKSSGKDKLRNALFGLLLALGAFILLYTINPDLIKITTLDTLNVTVDPNAGSFNPISYCYLRPGVNGNEVVDCQGEDGTTFKSMDECRAEWNKLSNPLAPCGVHEGISSWCYLEFNRDVFDDNNFTQRCFETENICNYKYGVTENGFSTKSLQSCQKVDVRVEWCFPEDDKSLGGGVDEMCFNSKSFCEEVIVNEDLEPIGEKVCQMARSGITWSASFSAGVLGVPWKIEEKTQALCQANLEFELNSAEGTFNVGSIENLKECHMVGRSNIPSGGENYNTPPDANIRQSFLDVGIKLNKTDCTSPSQTSCTHVGGLPSKAVSQLNILAYNLPKTDNCGTVVGSNTNFPGQSCKLVITGGTEAGHATHRPGQPIIDLRIDIPAVDSFIKENSTTPPAGICEDYGWPLYYINKNGINGCFYDEPARNGSERHWHVEFK